MEKKYFLLIFLALLGFFAVLLLTDSWWFPGVIVGVAALYALVMACKHGRSWLQKRHSKVARRERFLLFVLCLMAFFLCTGAALHLWAFYEVNEGGCGAHFSNAEYLLRSLACSFQLFAANIDGDVMAAIDGYEHIKGAIAIQAALSFSCTVAVLFSLVYARILAFVKFHRQTRVDDERNHLYVFFGMNEPSKLLAKSIRENEKDRALIVFVENIHMSEEEQGGWNSIVGLFTHRRQTFTDADEVDARVTFTETRLCDVRMEQDGMADILGEMNLLKLKELILKLSGAKDAKLHIFFLSEDEDENIRALSVMAMDSTIHEVEPNVSQHFYCHARRNGLNRVVEDIAVKRDLEVSIVDSSYISIELLKLDSKNHPVKLVELDPQNPTTVKSEFNGLIIGFDEVGQDALRFLYEFGAFVSSDATPKDDRRSPFHCVAVDRRMDELQGVFSTFAPAAMVQRNADGQEMIELKQCDCMSRDFYERVLNPGFAGTLNYVVISVGDDELGMSLAIRVLNHIRKTREDLSRLRIFVRLYDPDKEAYIQKIADYYNEGYRHDCKKDEYKTDAIIIPFGKAGKIYSYEVIIREDLTERGKRFQRSYAEMKGESEFWDLRRKLLTGAAKKVRNELGKKVPVDVPLGERSVSLDDIRSLRRKEFQDLANALHADTKIDLLLRAMPDDYDWEDFFRRYFDENNKPRMEGSFDQIRYPLLNDFENQVVLNLARLEHLRWNASHEMLGYTKAGAGVHGCVERTREHNCLRPWQELDEEGRTVSEAEGWLADYKAFDFGVVDITLMLNKDRLLRRRE